jgi:group I intron endonuclease
MAEAILASGGIYAIRHKVKGKQYIGSAVNFYNRFKEHRSKLRRGIHHSKKLQNAWVKYGPDAFEFVVLEVVQDRNDLIAREQYWLDLHDIAKTGYNASPTAGSILGAKASAETRAKMSTTHKAQAAERFEARSKAMTGRKLSEEHKAKIGAANKGRVPSEAARKKMSSAAKATPEHVRRKRAESHTGYRHTEESRRKISEGMRRRREAPAA